jgi:pantoate--beta-alanine ligase
VNPTQFNDPADLRAYPRSPARDLRLLSEQGCTDALFQPEAEEIYPPGLVPTTFSFGVLEEVMEGAMRPGHFAGVGQVVARLLHLVEADYLLLGEKDYQQFMVVRDLLRQLREKQKQSTSTTEPNLNGLNTARGKAIAATKADKPKIPELIMGSTHRDEGGLALSSRNQRLSSKGRIKARQIYAVLQEARRQWQRESPHQLVQKIEVQLAQEAEFRVEYVQLADSNSLSAVLDWKNHSSVRIFTAVWIEGVRLIDNMVVFP